MERLEERIKYKIISQAITTIGSTKTWSQGEYARTKRGAPAGTSHRMGGKYIYDVTHSEDAFSFCGVGAIYRCCPDEDMIPLADELYKDLNDLSLSLHNAPVEALNDGASSRKIKNYRLNVVKLMKHIQEELEIKNG